MYIYYMYIVLKFYFMLLLASYHISMIIFLKLQS